MKIKLSDNFSYKTIFRFVLPSIIMLFFTSFYGVVDGFFVSNFIGNEAFASVNLMWPYVMLLATPGFMIGTGGNALVAKTLGEGKDDLARKYFSLLFYTLIVVGTIILIVGQFSVEKVAIIFGATNESLSDCIIYARTIIYFIVFTLIQNASQSFFIAAERPDLGLKSTICAGLTNMILDYLFIAVLHMGIFGAALATGFSQFMGGIIPLLYFIFNKKSVLHLTKTNFNLKAILLSCYNGSSEMLTNIALSLCNILYNYQLMKYLGINGVNAYGIIIYVGFIFISIYLGFSMGISPIISYNYGSKNETRLKDLLKKSLIIISLLSIILTSLSQIFAKSLASIFTSGDIYFLELSTRAIRIFTLSYLFTGFNIFTSAFFTSLNNGLVSAIVSFVRTIILEILFIFITPLILGPENIWFAIIFSEFLSFIMCIIFLIMNKNRYKYF